MNKLRKIIFLLMIAIFVNIFSYAIAIATPEEDALIQDAVNTAQKANEETAVKVDERTKELLGELSWDKKSETQNPTSNSQDDLTSSKYTIKLKDINPVATSQESGGTVSESGKWIVTSLLGKISKLLLFLIPIIAAISFIVAGYYYILSSGDSEKASQAKTIIKWNIVAITIALFSYAIIKLIASILGGNI